MESAVNISPDLFAFCEWLFLGEDVPKGLVPEGYIYNHNYDGINIEETCCLAYIPDPCQIVSMELEKCCSQKNVKSGLVEQIPL